MMIKKRSAFRGYSKSTFLISVLAGLTFLFCMENVENKLITFNDNNENFYADVLLGYYLPPDTLTDELLYYTLDGELFTGTVTWYRKENDQISSKQRYQDGLIVEGFEFDKDGNQTIRFEYLFEDGVRAGFRQFGIKNEISLEWVGTPELGDSLTMIREWHPNGQLKFEMTSYSGEERPMVYEGLMTLYDEQGSILQQEFYKDGELIEKIK